MSMQFDLGKTHALLDSNGAGKTTLIRFINQILEPDSSSIYFKGKYIDRKFLNNIGYLPEERGMYTSLFSYRS